MAVLAAPFALPLLLIPTSGKNDDLVVLILFKMLLPGFCLMFFVFAFAQYFFIKFKLLKEFNPNEKPATIVLLASENDDLESKSSLFETPKS